MVPFGLVTISTADGSFIAVVIGAVAIFIAVAKRLSSTREQESPRNTVVYRDRFLQMKSDAEAKYGPAVKFLRPEMEMFDDPEIFDRAWREFQREGKRNRNLAAGD